MSKTIGIVGLGLIGGSLGLDLRSRGFQVYGVSRQARTCQIAVERGIADEAGLSLELLALADIIFICTPIAAIAPTLKQLIPYLSLNTIVTDVGSVKTPIVQECSQLWDYFVGSHPMAGTAEQGVEAAQKDLFVNAPYVLTPTTTTPAIATQKIEEIATLLGAKIYTCSPEQHDRAVAWISHLPVMVSAALIDACTSETDASVIELAKQLASSGFRDTSRVGGGNPELGVMMAEYNRENLLRSLSLYRDRLDRLIQYIQQEDRDRLNNVLESTGRSRPDFLT
ncbi:prephenate/arogenate dehydrogenase [Candidatus Gracilibacteria bacterium]|nr:prephenate/arogenate dehydrogenase [Candidatus Gracilibacteria bacterium]NJM85991.1 prephenate/arogenate dehydrogenase [Hydrococcus sp. RU_2_2]